jgi:tetratricopeptide (TPR) repeat protein
MTATATNETAGTSGRWIRLPHGPWRWALALGLCVVAAFAAVQGWAWYHFRAGQAADARFRTEEARTHLLACLQMWPRSPAALLLLARTERRAGHLTDAESYLDACRKNAGPETGEAISFEWALLQASMGSLRIVEGPLQARIRSRPADAPLIWEALAEGYRRMFRMPEAIACLDAWVEMDAANPHVYFLRGEIHRQVGAISRARDEYQQVVALDPNREEARRQLVRCLVKLGRHQDAIEHLGTLRAKAPNDPELNTLLAQAEHDLGQRAAGVARLDEVVRKHPGHGPALRERGRFALAAEQFADAAHWLHEAVRVLPYDYESHWSLYQALQAQGQIAEAKVELAKAQQLKDSVERIREIHMRLMTERPYDAALHCELGELLLTIGQPASAERWLQSAVALDPNLDAARRRLAGLAKATLRED